MKSGTKKSGGGVSVQMYRGSGEDAVTNYSCGAVEQARSEGVGVLVIRKNKQTGLLEPRVAPARMVHKPDLLSVYRESHEKGGQGKYIHLDAFQDGKTILGAQHVNPYLRDEGAYATIIEVFKKNIGQKRLSQLRAKVRNNFQLSTHLVWDGERNEDDCLALSEWMTAEQVWELACEMNPDLPKNLRKSKSGRDDVSEYKGAKEKFLTDLDVLRRATCIVNVFNGEREYCGGATPYSKPLEQCGFAIDKRFLTYDVDDEGNDMAQYYYRLAIGRAEPHILRRTDWAYEDASSTIAFLNEKVRRQFA